MAFTYVIMLLSGTQEEVEQQGEEAEGEGQEGAEGKGRGRVRHRRGRVVKTVSGFCS